MLSTRAEGRRRNELRPLKIVPHYLLYPEGSVLVEMGETKVICTATVSDDVPDFLTGTGQGWITAEYGMLPRAAQTRIRRERNKVTGRTYEIQRIIGRALRAIVDLSQLGERTILIDCDVIQADGGTRCASINGSYVALAFAMRKLAAAGLIQTVPLRDFVGAVSVGIVQGELVLDLDYREDSQAEVDANIIMTGEGAFVELQAAAEKSPYSKGMLDQMIKLGWEGIERVIVAQRKILEGI